MRSAISWGMPNPVEMVLTHFIVSDDVGRSRRFYSEVLGGNVVFSPEPTNVALANSWIVMNTGGGPTDDKPTVTLEAPRDLDRVSAFLNIRVKDIAALYARWKTMLLRCSNPKATGWDLYGGRGIRVCERWHSFENFVADMGEPPPLDLLPQRSRLRPPATGNRRSCGRCPARRRIEG